MVSQLKRSRKSLNSAQPTGEDHAANDEARIYTRLTVKQKRDDTCLSCSSTNLIAEH